MNIIEQIVTALLKWLTGLAKTPPTVEDAKPDKELKAKLLDRIDRAGGSLWLWHSRCHGASR